MKQRMAEVMDGLSLRSAIRCFIRCDIPTDHFTNLPLYSAIIGTFTPACFANAIASG